MNSNGYTPYGLKPIDQQGVKLAFNGETADPLTGNYLLGNGYRAFSPTLMRFLAPDSWSPFGKGGLNTYAYCVGDPVNNVDPGGHAVFNRIRRHAVVLTPDGPPPHDVPPPQTAQHLNRSLNRQRLQTGRSDPLTPPQQIQQPRANRNPLANGGRMPFEYRRNPGVPLSEVVTLANELMESKLHLARAPEYLKHVHDSQMRADYRADLDRIRSEVPTQQNRLNVAMVRWFHS